MNSNEIMEKLRAPFDEKHIEWRVQRAGKQKDGPHWAMVLAYVTNRAIMDRFDSVFGVFGWRNEYRDIPSGGVECGISVFDESRGWITKWDAADETDIEGTKGGRSNAMKRAAVQWGPGRYLYDLDECFVKEDQNGTRRQPAGKNNDAFKWNPPVLPAWALPAQSQQSTQEAPKTSAKPKSKQTPTKDQKATPSDPTQAQNATVDVKQTPEWKTLIDTLENAKKLEGCISDKQIKWCENVATMENVKLATEKVEKLIEDYQAIPY